jgi:hypothetical protein
VISSFEERTKITQVFENKVLRKILGPKDEVCG